MPPLPAGFRILPKIHKTPVQIRPIVHSKQFCLSPCSVFLDEHLKDILSGLPYVLKNSTALLESLDSLVIDQSCILVTGDVKSLYTNISVQNAIVVVDSICREFKIKETPLLIEMLRLVLMNNFIYCSELDKIFLQIWGLATGTPAAVAISRIYMFWLERPLVKKYNHLIKLYWCYIDDILLLWSGPCGELDNFMMEFNNLAPRITVNWSKPANEVDYLDLHIYKYTDVSDNKVSLVTETFQKPHKSDTVWNWAFNTPCKSLKGIMVLFEEKQSYTRDTSKIYNRKIQKVSVIVEDKPNQLYAQGMRSFEQYDETRKYFTEGKQRDNDANEIQKHLQLYDLSLGEYLVNKYALWLDFRTIDENELHGTGRPIENASEGITLQIEKKAESAGAYIYLIMDAQLNIQSGAYVSAVY